MKKTYSAEVESMIIIPKTMERDYNGMKISFIPNDKKILSEIVIEVNIENPEDERSEFKEISPGHHALNIGGTPGLHDKVLKVFHILESGLALEQIDKIRWDKMKVDWIPESEEEKEMVKVNSIQVERNYQKSPELIPGWILKDDLSKLEALLVPLAFFREGRREYHEHQYTNAFYNFYFVIEGLYGQGASSNIENKFLESKDLLRYANMALKALLKDPEIEKDLNEWFGFYNLTICEEDFIKLIVKVRHRIHHFWSGREEFHGHPYNQKLFNRPALMIMMLAWYILAIERSKALGHWEGE